MERKHDVSWWLQTNGHLELALAAIIRWHSVKDGFGKLLAAKCPLKVILTNSTDISGTKIILTKALLGYQRLITGERYMWINVQRTTTEGCLQAFECRIETSGSGNVPSFEPMPILSRVTTVNSEMGAGMPRPSFLGSEGRWRNTP